MKKKESNESRNADGRWGRAMTTEAQRLTSSDGSSSEGQVYTCIDSLGAISKGRGNQQALRRFTIDSVKTSKRSPQKHTKILPMQRKWIKIE